MSSFQFNYIIDEDCTGYWIIYVRKPINREGLIEAIYFYGGNISYSDQNCFYFETKAGIDKFLEEYLDPLLLMMKLSGEL